MLVTAISPSIAAERILQEWDFSKASGTLGWAVGEPVQDFRVADGALTGTATPPSTPRLESPIFEIDASAAQYVEIEMKAEADGTARMFYSDTTDEPYHGFRPLLYVDFPVKGGEARTYSVFPFWQKQGKIKHIRIDPPGNTFTIRAVRILSIKPDHEVESTTWEFKGSALDWKPVGEGEFQTGEKGWRITGSSDVTVFSPPFDIDSDSNLWAGLRISSSSERSVLLKWTGSELQGIQSVTIELRGGGVPHTYAVDLGDVRDWNGRVNMVGVSPSDSVEPGTITLHSVSIGSGPNGPPELEIKHFVVKEPFVRGGQKATLVADVQNVGGQAARTIAVAATLRDETESTFLPTQHRAVLLPGEIAHFEWETPVKKEGLYQAVVRANGWGLDSGQKSILVRFYPHLMPPQVPKTGYVPEPVPTDTGDYLVGCYYFPGWHTYERWSVLDGYPERRPVLGYYREGSPEVADWQINWALAHGINFFIYDWYWSDGVRQLEHGLHDGFLKSRYQDKMKFCLLWANHNAPSKSPEQDLMNVTQYWIDSYFKRGNYLKINGKNVIVIFSPQRLTDDLKPDGVKSAFGKMRKMCEDAGVGGLYLVACSYVGKDAIQGLVNEGYDAISGYNYPIANTQGLMRAPYEWMVAGYKDIWTEIAGTAPVPYIPVCEPGWDARPWHGSRSLVRTGKSPYLWEQMLTNAKTFVDEPGRRLPGGKKLVFLEAWNEFGEGDYIEPHAQYGFDYLEAVRSVFAPNSEPPLILTPPDVGLGPYDIPKPPPSAAWDFSKPDQCTWTVGNMSGLSFDGGTMRAEAIGPDPACYSPAIAVDASQFKKLEIRMRMDKGDEAQVFFSRQGGLLTEEKSVRFPVFADNEFRVYEVDLSSNRGWSGKIGGLRLDPNSAAGSRVEIAHIKLK